MANYPGTKLVGVAYKLRNKMKNSPLSVDVLHKNLDVVILRCCFAEEGKEMYQNVKRTCRVIVFARKIYCFAALSLSLPSPSSLLKLPINVTAASVDCRRGAFKVQKEKGKLIIMHSRSP